MSMQPTDYERGRYDAWQEQQQGLLKMLDTAQKERDVRADLIERLKAFGRDCVFHGDMTPGAQHHLHQILSMPTYCCAATDECEDPEHWEHQ